MKLYFSIIATLVAGMSSATACELYPGGARVGSVDPGCVALRAQGVPAVPAPRPYWSAQDRCSRHDGMAYGRNTNWACVPHSQRTGTGYEGQPSYEMGQRDGSFSRVVRTDSGSYMVRGDSTGITSYRIR